MKRIIALFAFLIPLLIAFPANALEGGISGLYEYDGERINGVVIDIYKIADYNGSSFDFLPGFEPVDISMMSNSELGEYGQELAAAVQTPIGQTQTINGEYAFGGMSEGIYLVVFKDIKIGDYTYSALPIVLTMPDLNENYQLALTTKLEKSCPDCEPEPEPEPIPPESDENANTRDTIWFFIRLLVVAIIIEMLTLFAIIKERKKEGENEN